MTKEVLQQALDYLDQHASSSSIPVRNAIKAALAKPEQWTPKDTAYRSGGLAQFDATLISEGTMPEQDHFADAGKPIGRFQCEPQPAVTEDGFTDWVCPKPLGYLMQCCGCNLIHEVETRVAHYEPRPSEHFEVVADPDTQVQWRMKRRDDLTPSNRQPLTDQEIMEVLPSGILDCLADPWDCGEGDGIEVRSIERDAIRIARAIESAHGIGDKT